jgi:hypothetical protein
MALRALLLAAAALLAAAGAPESYDYEDDAPAAGPVAVLTATNFDAEIKAHKHVLAEFYAPWCGVSTRLSCGPAGQRLGTAAQSVPLLPIVLRARLTPRLRRSQHCKQLAPEYEAAATQLKEIAPDVLLAKARPPRPAPAAGVERVSSLTHAPAPDRLHG